MEHVASTRADRVHPRTTPSVRSAVLPFTYAGLLAFAVLGIGGTAVLHAQSTTEAVRDASLITETMGRAVLSPNLGDGLLTGDPAAIDTIDRVVRAHVLTGDVVRVKIWSVEGRILYSDEASTIGEQFPLDDEIVESLAKWQTTASVSDLSRSENELERPFGKLLEVYSPLKTVGGVPVALELYQRYSAVSASGLDLSWKFAPILLLALALLQTVQVPLAWSMASRLREGQREREALLTRAVEASDLERRRIARDVHDGLVQDLIGLSLEFTAAAEAPEPASVRTMLLEAAGRTRRAIRELRSFLVDIYPPSLQQTNLSDALSDLVEPLRARDVDVSLEIGDPSALSRSAQASIYRAAQEAIRNVVRHARASRVLVSLVTHDARAVLTVTDDGLGFDPEQPLARNQPHFGMQILRDLAHDAGGTVQIESERGRGTTVRFEVAL